MIRFQFYTCLLLSVFFSNDLRSQDKEIYILDSLDLTEFTEVDRNLLDSALKIYHESDDELQKLHALEDISENIWHPSWKKYNEILFEQLVEINIEERKNEAERDELRRLLANAYNNKGFVAMEEGNMSDALIHYREAMRIAKDIGWTDHIATVLNNMGYAYEHLGDVDKAVECTLESIKIREQENNYDGLNTAFINLGYIYYEHDQNDKAEEYFIKGWEVSKKINDTKGEATALNNLGKLMDMKGENNMALNYFNQSLVLKEKLGDKTGIAMTLINIGMLSLEMKDDSIALDAFKKALSLSQEMDYTEGIWAAQYQFALFQQSNGNYYKALMIAKECMDLANQLQYPDDIKRAALLLSVLYEELGNYQESLKWHKLYSLMKDSIDIKKARASILKQGLKYEYEKKELAALKEQEKKDLITKQKESRQQILILIGLIGFVILIVFTTSLFNRFKVIKKQKSIIEVQKKIVESKSEEIEASITYAKRIQEAVLPPLNMVKDHLPNNFIFYKPKDIVAGDFYWFAMHKDQIFIAAADCTGHGVPGAMVSLICANALNRSVNEMGLIEPSAILDMTRELVLDTFAKSEVDVKDGMDIALCRIDKEKKEIVFSGAHNSLYIVTGHVDDDKLKSALFKDGRDIIEIKGDRQPIGKFINSKAFMQHTYKVKDDDIFFLFSDGYPDQFGGEKGRKFMYKPFKRLLLANAAKSMDEQMHNLNQSFETWRGNREQIDDVVVIGFKI